MFKENFIKLCNEKNVAPTVVCKHIGLTGTAYSKWNDETIPRRATLMRIAEYFGVTVDYLLGKEQSEQPKEVVSFEKQQLHKKIDSVSDEEAKLFLSMFDLILKSKDNNENN